MLLNLYLLVGLVYAGFIWWNTPEDKRSVEHFGHAVQGACMALGIALLWPAVAYVNHFWEVPPED